MEAKIKKIVTGYPTRDGAGVNLVRVLSNRTVTEFDPFLMLDSFQSDNPADYLAGFPLHPHRGIETISYVYKGKMVHRDSLANEDAIGEGEVQWMCAGSGIMHEERLPESKLLLGVQLWLNLPEADKMCYPGYNAIKREMIEKIPIEHGQLHLLAGRYLDHQGHMGSHLPLDYYDIHLNPHGSITIAVEADRSVMLFTLVNGIIVDGTAIAEKSAVKLTEATEVTITAGDHFVQVLFMSSKALKEPVAWGGPIVMNTNDELRQAFADLENGTFIKEKIRYEKE
ncbi:MAG: pirin family protein [Erysipelotrichaceae bacterium]|nr:pirin family protein [Erysipelotrichaceae bacterium]MDD3810083.1 pirin family protein [Erysipelotrichaceae bacterium]